MGQHTVEIFVRPDKERLVFDRAGLAYHSDHFCRALYSPPRYELHLEEEDPITFQMLIRWINVRNVDTDIPIFFGPTAIIGGLIRLLLLAEKYGIYELPEHCYSLIVLRLLENTGSMSAFTHDGILELWKLAPDSNIRFLPLAYFLSLRDERELGRLSHRLHGDNLLSRDIAKLTLLLLREEIPLSRDWVKSLKWMTIREFYDSIKEAEVDEVTE